MAPFALVVVPAGLVGAGYVGLVTGTCLADVGNDVLGGGGDVEATRAVGDDGVVEHHVDALRHGVYTVDEEAAATDGSYTVTLARSQRMLQIQPGQTLLDGLIAIGAEPTFSCQQGICGTCEVRVLEGTPDHRDMVLTDAEKAANDRMMVCCSGAQSTRLVLDL